MTALWVGIFAGYALFTEGLRYWWQRNAVPPSRPARRPALCVVIPARNEADRIGALLADLQAQTYAAAEVVVVDDASDDATARVVAACLPAFGGRARLLSLPPDPQAVAHKKRALQAGIAATTAEIIVLTDADCRVPPRWLARLADVYAATDAVLVSGPVVLVSDKSLFGAMQTVEFASLVGAGAASLRAGFPNMCNGANLSYRRAAFAAVGGFAGTDHLASGDDELLMHKLAVRFPGQLHFLRTPEAVVRTAAAPDWPTLARQRRRWASKWPHYRDPKVRGLAVGVFAFHLAVVAGGPLVLAGRLRPIVYGLALGSKAWVEWRFLRRVLHDLGQPIGRKAFWALQVAHSPYVVLFGLLGARGKGYEWKGRRVH